MLTEGQRQLLTAFVDGELSESQRQQVRGLVEQSSEARRLLKLLEEDAGALRGMASPALDQDLARSVLQTIARRRLEPRHARHLSHSIAFPAWAGLTSVAAVLLLVGGVTYLYFSAAFKADHDKTDSIAVRKKAPMPEKAATAIASELPGRPNFVETPPPKGPLSPPARDSAAPPEPHQLANNEPKQLQVTQEKKAGTAAEVIAAPSMERFELKTVTLRLPAVFALRELNRDPVKARFFDQLGKGSALRIELPCGNASRAFERFEAAAKEQRFALVVDAFTQARLKLPQFRTHYAVFMEDATPGELAHLLLLLDAEDRKVSSKRPADFESVVLVPVSGNERKEVADLLGFDPSQPASPRSMGPLGTDPSRPLADLTASQVSESLAGQGGSRQSGKVIPTPPQHQALVTAFGVPRPRGMSVDARRFQELRKPARLGTVQALLVLRQTGAK